MWHDSHLRFFFEIQTDLPNLSSYVKIKNPLNISKIKFKKKFHSGMPWIYIQNILRSVWGKNFILASFGKFA